MLLRRILPVVALPALLLAPALSAQTPSWRVETAPEWDALFDLHSGGWTGADGIFSLPQTGTEVANGYLNTDTLFIFSDTFTDDVNIDGSRSNMTIVHNTVGLRPAGGPAASAIQMVVNQAQGTGDPVDMFKPTVPGSGSFDWYWLKDGIVLNGRTYIIASRWGLIGQLQFGRKGIVMIEIPAGDPAPFANHTQELVPLYVDAPVGGSNIVYGGAIMANTVTAGAPAPDGYIYIYGNSDSVPGDGFNKLVYVARVLEADFGNISLWRYWDGSTWSTNIADSAGITDESSLENSVTPLPNGQFLMVFQHRQISPWVAMRIGQSPVGPWTAPIKIYEVPIPAALGSVFPYNAKAHPHLSAPGEMLISYNVNSLRNVDNRNYSDIYRPRFIKLIVQ